MGMIHFSSPMHLPALLDRAVEIAEAKADDYGYELDGSKREELERIMASAEAELS